jgi:L-idonate 5-dehydrogenase
MPAPGLRVLPEGLAPERAVLTEPLSDALHAVYRAGDVACARVLVTGAGPIGSLRRRGTAQVLVSDLTEHSLAVARAARVTATLSADHPDDWADLPPVDVVVECSGTPPGLRSALTAVRRGGPGGPAWTAATRAGPLRGQPRGDPRVHPDGRLPVRRRDQRGDRPAGRGLPVDEVVTATFPLARAHDAFALAGDRTRASKVLLDLR